MAVKGEQRGLLANGPKIKELRKRRGMSQKSLKSAASLSESTLKRAEQGARVMPEVLSEIAKCLKVGIEEVSLSADNRSAENHSIARPGWEIIRLNNTLSAQEIAKKLSAYKDAIKFEVLLDPDEALAEKVARAVEAIEALSDHSGAAARIRRLGQLNSLLQELANEKAFVFVGGYFERSIESEDGEYEDARWTLYSAVERGITLVEFSPEEGRHHTREVRVGMTADEQFERMTKHEAAGRAVNWGNVIPF